MVGIVTSRQAVMGETFPRSHRQVEADMKIYPMIAIAAIALAACSAEQTEPATSAPAAPSVSTEASSAPSSSTPIEMSLDEAGQQ